MPWTAPFLLLDKYPLGKRLKETIQVAICFSSERTASSGTAGGTRGTLPCVMAMLFIFRSVTAAEGLRSSVRAYAVKAVV